MAALQPVCEEEWERHKDVLRNMYCTDKLPLLNRKGNGHEPGVVELMKERHAFVASPSQYELQFKKWGFTKNLKSGEWAALIAQYDRLRQTKSDVRITVSGSVLNKKKIDKARRRYRINHNGTRGAMHKGGALPASRQAHVEYLDEFGKWTRHSGSQVKSSTALIMRKSGPNARDNRVEDEHRPETPPKDTDSSLLRDLPLELSSPFREPFATCRPFSPIINVDDLFNNSTFTFDDCIFSSFASGSGELIGLPHVSASYSNSTATSIVSNQADCEIYHREFGLERPAFARKGHLEGDRALITSLVQHGKMALCSNTNSLADIPDVEEIMESLESLLPETETPAHDLSGQPLSKGISSPSSNLFQTLLYSFKNNFAGLRDVPRAAIMQLIREHHDIRMQLFEVIKSGQPGIANPLAYSFFRAAVEGNDADAVATIIRHAKYNSKIVIDPNEVVCSSGDDDYTPIELAAKFRNTELVRALLNSRADPNKTRKPDNLRKWEQGALGLALGRWDNGSLSPFTPSPPGEPEPVNLGLLKLLLSHGAEVRVDLIENAMRPGPGHSAVAEELMSRIPPSQHRNCFNSRWLLVSAIHYLDNSAANIIVRRLITQCSESKDCGKCVSEHPILIEKLLCHSARRANLDLTKFLTQHTAELQSGLAAAIRSSSDELIHFLLSKGARVDAPAQSWRQCNLSQNCCRDLYDENGYDRPFNQLDPDHNQYVITPIRTPLAEAIRSRNQPLIKTFEKLGACARLSDKHHYHATAVAAAEVGDVCYLKTVLSHASSQNEGSMLTLALAVAIRNDETESALILLDAGANLDTPRADCRLGDPFIIALERWNKRVVDSMFECDVRFAPWSPPNGKSVFEAAAAWGDFELINDLTRVRSSFNSGVMITPLGAAVKTRDKMFVSQILDLGADPNAKPYDSEGVTTLAAAMEIGDYDMARYLISRGTSPDDTCAFLYAMGHDPVGYEFLLSELKKKHPHGVREFGGELLAKALEQCSQPLMESLLRAGVDINSWGKSELRRLPESIFTPRTHAQHRHRVLGLAIQHLKARHDDFIRVLLERGADPNLIVYKYERLSPCGLIWIHETPLLLAIQSRKLQVVRMLLDHGAELNRPARRGIKQTPLQAACEAGSYTIVEFLLGQGAKVNDPAAERFGGTALQLASKSGSLKIVRLLLDNRADPFMPKSKVGGRTAFEAAAENGRIDVLYQLWNAVLPLGFSQKECQSAKEFAEQNGHRGCAEFIDFLSGGSSQSFLNG